MKRNKILDSLEDYIKTIEQTEDVVEEMEGAVDGAQTTEEVQANEEPTESAGGELVPGSVGDEGTGEAPAGEEGASEGEAIVNEDPGAVEDQSGDTADILSNIEPVEDEPEAGESEAAGSEDEGASEGGEGEPSLEPEAEPTEAEPTEAAGEGEGEAPAEGSLEPEISLEPEVGDEGESAGIEEGAGEGEVPAGEEGGSEGGAEETPAEGEEGVEPITAGETTEGDNLDEQVANDEGAEEEPSIVPDAMSDDEVASVLEAEDQVTEAVAEAEEAGVQVDEQLEMADEAIDTVEEIDEEVEALEEYLKRDGGIHPQSVRYLQAKVAKWNAVLGDDVIMVPSVESFGSTGYRYQATQDSLESLKATSARIKELVKKILGQVQQLVRKAMTGPEAKVKRTAEQVKQLAGPMREAEARIKETPEIAVEDGTKISFAGVKDLVVTSDDGTSSRDKASLLEALDASRNAVNGYIDNLADMAIDSMDNVLENLIEGAKGDNPEYAMDFFEGFLKGFASTVNENSSGVGAHRVIVELNENGKPKYETVNVDNGGDGKVEALTFEEGRDVLRSLDGLLGKVLGAMTKADENVSRLIAKHTKQLETELDGHPALPRLLQQWTQVVSVTLTMLSRNLEPLAQFLQACANWVLASLPGDSSADAK